MLLRCQCSRQYASTQSYTAFCFSATMGSICQLCNRLLLSTVCCNRHVYCCCTCVYALMVQSHKQNRDIQFHGRPVTVTCRLSLLQLLHRMRWMQRWNCGVSGWRSGARSGLQRQLQLSWSGSSKRRQRRLQQQLPAGPRAGR